MRRTKWFEREFDFSLPVGVFPCVVERLRGTPARIEDLLARFRAARLRLVRRLEALSEEEVAASALHPRLQKQMRVIDMALFVAEHDDNHLATITELSRNAEVGLRNAD